MELKVQDGTKAIQARPVVFVLSGGRLQMSLTVFAESTNYKQYSFMDYCNYFTANMIPLIVAGSVTAAICLTLQVFRQSSMEAKLLAFPLHPV